MFQLALRLVISSSTRFTFFYPKHVSHLFVKIGPRTVVLDLLHAPPCVDNMQRSGLVCLGGKTLGDAAKGFGEGIYNRPPRRHDADCFALVEIFYNRPLCRLDAYPV